MCNMMQRVAFPIAVLSLACTMGFTATAIAAPIELENDVDIGWSDAPCTFGPPVLCRPAEELIRVVGAPRLVPDASNAGSLLDISVDFVGVHLDLFGGLSNETPLILNVYDLDLDPVLRPGEAVPLELTYLIPPTSGSLNVPATDVFLQLDDFSGFGLLPAGDLIFSVTFAPRLAITDRAPDRPDHAVVITLSGVGSTEVPVPEPSTLLLLLSGFTITAVRARRRRSCRSLVDARSDKAEAVAVRRP